MNVETLNCEDELIHLSGKIQNFGYLIVFDLQLHCIAISENCSDWIPIQPQKVLNNDLDYFLNYIQSDKHIKDSVNDLDKIFDNSFTCKVKLNNNDFQLTIYPVKDQIFFEFEKKSDFVIEPSQLNELQQKFDKEEDTWQTLCNNIFEIIDFDRIMVYQFLEDSSGIVIAEHTKEKTESLIGYRYPAFDIPAQARELYTKNLSRQTPDIKGKTSNIIGLHATAIDLTKSQIRALSPLHLLYLENFGVTASASFSIIIDNKLWGLIACQNLSPKYIPYDQRILCLFLTQYAANTYLIKAQRKNFAKRSIINDIELKLKEQLYYNPTIEKTLNEFAETFMNTLSSTGLIIKINNYTFKHGETPDDITFNEIHEQINKKVKTDNIFTTHSCLLDDNLNENKNWSGVARISFDKEQLNVIYWFRKEIVIEEKWAGIPEKYSVYSEEKNAFVYSPRTSFQVWTKEVKGQSKKWSEFDHKFLTRIHNQIQDSIIQKYAKDHQIKERLVEINNQLETYTHQLEHDLKNPLSIIKMNAQFILLHPEIEEKKSSKLSTSIVEAATLINDIMEKTLESTKSTPSVLTYESIEVDVIIKYLIEQAINRYQINNFNLEIGELHPVYGEKTLLHQLFMNLINNAIKFSSKSESTYLKITSTLDNRNTTYYIQDNGIGISENELPNIFSMFKRFYNAQDYEGSGVGMSIVKRVVDRLNAEISIESQIGVGTTFKIIFPNE